MALVNKTIQTFCKMLLHENIRKTDKRTATNINKKGIKHAREANINGRIEINATGSKQFCHIKRPQRKLFKSTNCKITKSHEK